MSIEVIGLVVLAAVGGLAVTTALGYRAARVTIEAELRATSKAIGQVLEGTEEASRALASRAESLDAAVTAALTSIRTLTNAAVQYRDVLPDLGELMVRVARTGSAILQSVDNVSRGLTGVGSMLGRITPLEGARQKSEGSQ